MNVLILGAGLMQKPAILSAKELGFTVNVIDADENAVSIKYADTFRKIDLKAKDEILEYAGELKSNGGLCAVFTAGTDFSSSVSYVCEKMGLPAHSYEASLNASIKTRMRECFDKSHVPSPSFIKVNKNDLNDALCSKVLERLSFPFVVKPVDNMGARGCRMVRNEKEFVSAVKTAVDFSRTQNAIIEEYMDGPEYSIDALVYNGTMTVTGFAERHIYYPPYFIETGHTMPAVLSKKMHDELISVFALGVKALGLTCGAAKADIKYTKNGPMIGEIAARLSGGYMSGWTYPYASDLNLTKQALLIACGKTPDDLLQRRERVDFNPGKGNFEKPYELFEVKSVRCSAERAWISIPGKVKYIENIDDYTDRAVFDILPRATVSTGSEVDFPRNNVSKCGNIISVSNDYNIAVEAAENAVSNVFITLEPFNPATDKFLNYEYADDEEKFPPSAFGELSEDQLNEIPDVIKEKESLKNNVPKFIKSADYIKRVDWTYNSIYQILEKFDVLRPDHPALDGKRFWKALFRGGLQACVYVSDSTRREK